ncbi:MAG: sodium:calcium antiporter [Chloroflexi bacterium]|nr:sodium:calcium antiporter [Chloroflexota bacterium]
MLEIGLLVASLFLILLAAELFTNSIEWAGHKLRLSEGVVGSVLAAVGTALPETIIPIVAVLFGSGGEHSEAIGIGAILGAPFMLATLAMFVTGAAVFAYRKRRAAGVTLNISHEVLGRDLRYFFIAYAVAVVAAFVGMRAVQIFIAIALVGLYVFYLYQHATEGGAVTTVDHEAMPLHFHRRSADPMLSLISLQIVAALAIMVGGAYYFVQSISALAGSLGVPALVLALIVAPIATELPEKFNSVLWVRKGKDTLSLGNITGAMVFQSCLPVTFGILFTQWAISSDNIDGFVSAFIAIGSGLMIFGTMAIRKRLTASMLIIGGFWYVVFMSYVLLRNTLF